MSRGTSRDEKSADIDNLPLPAMHPIHECQHQESQSKCSCPEKQPNKSEHGGPRGCVLVYGFSHSRPTHKNSWSQQDEERNRHEVYYHMNQTRPCRHEKQYSV